MRREKTNIINETELRDTQTEKHNEQDNERSLTRTALSRTTCETVSRNCAAIPGLLRPRVNFLSAIVDSNR